MSRIGRPLFVATILTGSFLLFLVQPMIARMALPRLGGAPAVWNSAMLVYQSLLLAGYGYAHGLGRFSPRVQGGVHLVVLLLAAAWLPIGLSVMAQPAHLGPALYVPLLLGASIGPLFFAVAAQAPLMQRWFALGRPGDDPYWLYAASNLGSFGGLLAYPLLVEPRLTLAEQSWLWTAGYGLLVLLVAGCALAVRRLAGARDRPVAREGSPSPTWPQWLRWIALAAVPSGLMLSTTTHLTTDIVAMPLIWVIPLGLYLLSFSIAFATDRRLARWIGAPFPVAVVIAGELAFSGFRLSPALPATVDILLLFVVAVALHGRLFETRPDAGHLTAFYFASAIGGALGGLFCALIAPALFDWPYEHPILIIAAALLLPQRPLFGFMARIGRDPQRGWLVSFWMAMAAFVFSVVPGGWFGDLTLGMVLVLVALLALIAFFTVGHRLAFGLALVAVMLGGGGWDTLRLSATPNVRTRSYFGVYTVSVRSDAAGRRRELVNGTTLHGVQRMESGHELYETSYYAPRSAAGLAARAAPRLYGPHARIGIVGLGAGTLACYRQPGQVWTLYEIDPAVVRIARETGGFTFLQRCAPDAHLAIGDARLTLAAQPSASLDVLMIDAFTSDAVPIHLLTREALAVYKRVLAPKGLLLVHISNRFFDLEPVLSAGADQLRLYTSLRDYQPTGPEHRAGATRSIWVALSADRAPLDALVRMEPGGWRAPEKRRGFRAWTDDYSSVLPLLRLP